MSQIVIRFLVGGAIVSAFAVLGDLWHPRGFAGLFAAAPSVALATLREKHERDGKRNAGITSTIRGRLAAALDARGAISHAPCALA
jgi:4-hydroxybenzoate polyprenyltransferase